MLSLKRIESLAARRGVNKTAIENFLCSLDGLSLIEALGNLELDSNNYEWDHKTIAAIQTGILENFRED
jgi:hypothetical protein